MQAFKLRNEVVTKKATQFKYPDFKYYIIIFFKEQDITEFKKKAIITRPILNYLHILIINVLWTTKPGK